jgi:chromosomal replication initiator protein
MNVSVYAIPGLKIETTCDIIEKAVCEVMETTPEIIRTKTRKREVVEPRMMTMYFFRKFTRLGVGEIGRALGGFHHATVLHSIQTVETLKTVDHIFAHNFHEIYKRMQSRLL